MGVHVARSRRKARIVGVVAMLGTAAAAVVLGVSNQANADTCKDWTGAVNSSWTTAGNWTPSGAPAATDCVTLTTGSPTIATGSTISVTNLSISGATLTINGTGSLTATGAASAFSGGTLDGIGTFTVAGTMTWTGGTMLGAGSTVVASGATLGIVPTTYYAAMDTRTLTNNSGGTVNYAPVANSGWSWYFGVSGNTSAFVNNGTFTYVGSNSNDPGIGSNSSNSSITNGATGTFTRTAGTGVAYIGPAIRGTGPVTSNAGTASFVGGGSGSSTFTGNGAARVSLEGGTFKFDNGTTLAGGVSVVGSATVVAGSTTANSTANVTISGSNNSIDGGGLDGNGSFTISGTVNWTGGTMYRTGSGTGPKSTIVASGGTLNIAPTTYYAGLDARTLVNNSGGLVNYAPTSGSGWSWYFGLNGNPASFVNNGSFTYSGPNTADPGINSNSGTDTIVNGSTGTFSKTAGTTTSAVGPVFQNGGTVGATAGTLQLNGGGTAALGAFGGTSPGVVSLNSGTFTLANGSTFTGRVSVSGNSTVVAGSTTANSTANVTISGSNNSIDGGSLDGNGSFTISGTVNWTGGGMLRTGTGTGPKSTIVASGGTLNVTPTSYYAFMDSRTLTNNVGGTVSYAPTTSSWMWYFGWNGNPTPFVNNGSFTYVGPNADDPGLVSGSSADTIVNGATGTFSKTAGTSTSAVGPLFQNGGAVGATAGTLQLNGGGTAAVGTFGGTSPGVVSLNSGTFTLADGSAFTGGVSVTGSATVVAGSTIAASTANVALTGTNSISGGSLDGNGTFTISGTVNWLSGGMLRTGSGTGPGATVVTSGGVLNIKPTDYYSYIDKRSLTNNVGGTVAYEPQPTASGWYFGWSGNPSSFVNNGAFTYAVPSGSDPGINDGSGASTITNGATGTFTKTVGSTTSHIPLSFDNNGTLSVNAGTLEFDGPFAAYNGTNTLNKGTYTITSPGILMITGVAITTNKADITVTGGAAAPIQDTGGNNAMAAFANNQGSLKVVDRTLSTAAFANSGTVVVGGGASPSALNVAGSYTQSAGSTLLKNSNSTLTTSVAGTIKINAGTLSGIGTANDDVTSSGTVAPGDPAGTLVAASYAPSAAATFEASVDAGVGSSLVVAGTAALQETLAISTTGAPPAEGSVFNIVVAGSRTGTFATVTGQDIPSTNLYYDLSYTPTAAVLTVKHLPKISVGDASIVEGNSGTSILNLPVTLDAASGRTVTVDYSTSDGTASSPGDYASVSGTLTFLPGETSKFVPITINGDAVYEADETVTLTLSNPTKSQIDDGTATGTIQNDEPAPTVTGITPNTIGQGGTDIDVAIAGTGFRPDMVLSVSGSGVSTSAMNVVDPTHMTAKLSATAAATLGARDVTVTIPTLGSWSCAGCLTVKTSPTVTSMSANILADGIARTETLTGTGFVTGMTVTVTKSGEPASSVVVTGTSVTSATKATATFTVDPTATPGAYAVNAKNTDGGVSATAPNLTVVAAPTVTSISPGTVIRGHSDPVTITGTGFVTGAALTGSPGVTFSSVSVVNPTTITATMTITAATAPNNDRNVKVTNAAAGGFGVGSGNVLNIIAQPSVTGISLDTIGQAAAAAVHTITGTGFLPGSTVTISGTKVTPSAVDVVNSTTIKVSLAATSTAATGPRDVTVTEPGFGPFTCSGCLTVNLLPKATGISINTLSRGLNRDVTITGTGFATGMKVVITKPSAATAVTATAVEVISPTQATAHLTVRAAASLGVYSLRVTNLDGGTNTAANMFTVVDKATLTSMTPNVAPRGFAGSVTLTGTGFMPGAAVTGPAQVTFTNVVVVNSTTITADLTIGATATRGTLRKITVTNSVAGGSATCSGKVLEIT